MKPRAELQDWGTVDYPEALERQRAMFDELRITNYELRIRNSEEKVGWLIFCEHPHVYTLGRSGKEENLLVSEKLLRERGASLHRTERGGDITYHGPGQIVCYPILDLERLGLGLRGYIEALEQAVIETMAAFGIEAGRIEGKTGVWVGRSEVEQETGTNEKPFSSVWYRCRADRSGEEKERFSSKMVEGEACDGVERGAYSNVCNEFGDERNEAYGRFSRKLCAIGVRASRGVVMHGLALNVATDLAWFDHINPCGFVGGAVTSMEKEIGGKVDMNEAKKLLRERLKENLEI